MRDFLTFCDAIDSGAAKKVAKYLRTRSLDYEHLNKSVAFAAKAGQIKILDMLCAHPWFDAHWRNNLALDLASGLGHTECVRMLLDKGAHACGRENSAMWSAARAGHTHIVELLLPSWSGSEDVSTLVQMAHLGHTKHVLLLWPKSPNAHKSRAFMTAALADHDDLLQVLLPHVVFCETEQDDTNVYVDLSEYEHNKHLYEDTLRDAISRYSKNTLTKIVDPNTKEQRKKSKI